MRVRTASESTTGAEKTEKVLSEELSSRSIVSGIENKLYIRRLRSKPIFKIFLGEGKKYPPKFFWVRRLMVNHWSPKPGLQVRFLPDPHPIILKIVQRFVQFFWLASTQTTQFAGHA